MKTYLRGSPVHAWQRAPAPSDGLVSTNESDGWRIPAGSSKTFSNSNISGNLGATPEGKVVP